MQGRDIGCVPVEEGGQKRLVEAYVTFDGTHDPTRRLDHGTLILAI